jgi:hypothetical protein
MGGSTVSSKQGDSPEVTLRFISDLFEASASIKNSNFLLPRTRTSPAFRSTVDPST